MYTMKINTATGIIITKHRFHFDNSTGGIVRSLNTEKGNSKII